MFKALKLLCIGLMACPVWLVVPAYAGGYAQSNSMTGALMGGLVGALTAPSKNKEGHALIGAGIGGTLGYMMGNERDKQTYYYNEPAPTYSAPQPTYSAPVQYYSAPAAPTPVYQVVPAQPQYSNQGTVYYVE